MKKWLLTALFLVLLFLTQTITQQPSPSKKVPVGQTPTSPTITPNPNDQLAQVIKVIDGDTIEIEGGQRVRYIGINTPETVDPRRPVQCFGQEASQKNKELASNKEVRLEKDVSETDRYGRLLRYVFVGEIFVNDYLVREGYAYASSYPPDIKYQEQFRQAEQEAKANQKGLWGSTCQTTSQGINQTTNNCQIKGNISSSGEKIYHLPGQKYYDKTVIDPSQGEQWFCTEEEAQKDGWRKSKV